MNQILSTNMPSNNNSRKNNKMPTDIKNVLKVFAIILIVFGVLIIGVSFYAVYKKQNGAEKEVAKPTISLENKTDTTILLKVMGQERNIAQVSYGWNDEEKKVIEGNNRKYIEEEISIPSGKNTLYIVVTDENGQEIPYQKEYEIQSNINLEVSGNKIKIKYEGENEISYMTYRWDDGEETKIDINDTKIEQEIDAVKGLHTLTVIVVDTNNNTETKVQKINGVEKPKLEIDVDEDKKHYVITTQDDTGLQKIEIRLNQDDSQKFLINIEGKTEYNCTLPMELQQGDNLIEVTVYNTNGVTEYRAGKFVKQ
ncbi:MAG: hypothetical protein V8R82_07405 [Clostridia bacterium]